MDDCKEHNQPVSWVSKVLSAFMPTPQEFHKTALTALVSSVTNIHSTGHEDAPHIEVVFNYLDYPATVTVEDSEC